MIKEKKVFPNRIAEIRNKRGYSGIEFAEMVGIRNDTLSKIENCKARPSLQLLMKIADKLGVTLNDIFLK